MIDDGSTHNVAAKPVIVFSCKVADAVSTYTDNKADIPISTLLAGAFHTLNGTKKNWSKK